VAYIVTEVVRTVLANVVVSGRVQGVGFRFFAVGVAEQLGITGWVRNLNDGRVEVVAYGVRGMLEVMIARLRQGPSAATVSDVDVAWCAEHVQEDNPLNFKILR